jgi:hypothetical protein
MEFMSLVSNLEVSVIERPKDSDRSSIITLAFVRFIFGPENHRIYLNDMQLVYNKNTKETYIAYPFKTKHDKNDPDKVQHFKNYALESREDKSSLCAEVLRVFEDKGGVIPE